MTVSLSETENIAHLRFAYAGDVCRISRDSGLIGQVGQQLLERSFVFPAPPAVGHQVFDAVITPELFAEEIAPCRTFCEKTQIDYLRSIGLIKGGSLDNAVVLDGETILNPTGFKVPKECVNHKVLDALGDMYTAGLPLIGRLTAHKTGHYHNNQLLKALFADKTNYEIIEE